MKILTDNRRIRVNMINMVNGELVSSYAGDAWQQDDGTVSLGGLWADLVPASKEDHNLMASAAGVSPLEWLYQRLLTCPIIPMEVFD